MCRADVEERLSAGDRTDAIKDEDGKRVSSNSKHSDSEMLGGMKLFGGVGRTASMGIANTFFEFQAPGQRRRRRIQIRSNSTSNSTDPKGFGEGTTIVQCDFGREVRKEGREYEGRARRISGI